MSAFEQGIRWRPAVGSGSEVLRLRLRKRRGVRADGTVVGSDGEREFQMTYAVGCDAFWRVQGARVRLLHTQQPDVVLRSDGRGNWADGRGTLMPQLDGCIDIDISATPFTNTLPIKRLALRPGASAEISVAFIDVPAMTVESVRQRYTCLDHHATGATYRFESLPCAALPDGFSADLPVDADGLVLDYPGLFRRGEDAAE